MKYSFLHYSLLDVNSNPINLSIHVHCTVQMYGSQHQRRPNAAHRRWQRSILRSILAISWNYRVTIKWSGQSQNWTTHYGWHTRWMKTAGWDMWYEWITSAYLDRHCTGRFRGVVQVIHVQTGGAQSTRTCGWESHGTYRKQRWQLITDQNDVGVWPNASIHLDEDWIKVKVKK